MAGVCKAGEKNASFFILIARLFLCGKSRVVAEKKTSFLIFVCSCVGKVKRTAKKLLFLSFSRSPQAACWPRRSSSGTCTWTRGRTAPATGASTRPTGGATCTCRRGATPRGAGWRPPGGGSRSSRGSSPRRREEEEQEEEESG